MRLFRLTQAPCRALEFVTHILRLLSLLRNNLRPSRRAITREAKRTRLNPSPTATRLYRHLITKRRSLNRWLPIEARVDLTRQQINIVRFPSDSAIKVEQRERNYPYRQTQQPRYISERCVENTPNWTYKKLGRQQACEI